MPSHRLPCCALMFCLLGACAQPVIEGRVVDDLGVAVEGATIHIPNTTLTTKTDGNGNYGIEFVPGDFELIAEKDGYISASLALKVSEKTRYPAQDVVLYKIPTIKLEAPGDSSETIKGKWFIIKGTTDRPADVFINGNSIQLSNDYVFEQKVPLRIGKNSFRIDAWPIHENKDQHGSKEIAIIRELFPAEAEYRKVSNHTVIHKGRIDEFAIDSKEQHLSVVAGHADSFVYDLQKNSLVQTLPDKGYGYSKAVAFSPDAKRMMIGRYYSNTIDFFDVNGFGLIKSVKFPTEKKVGSNFAICENTNIVVSSGGGIWIVDAANGALGGAFTPSASPDTLVWSGNCKFLSYATGKTVKVLDGNSPFPMKRLIGTVYNNETLMYFYQKEWEKLEQENSKATEITQGDVVAMTFTPSERELVLGTKEGKVLVAKVEKDKSLTPIEEKSIGDKVYSLCFTRDGSKLLVGLKNSIIALDYPTLNNRLAFKTGGEFHGKIVMSKDGKSFYYSCKGFVKKASLNIDWKLIDEFYALKRKGTI